MGHPWGSREAVMAYLQQCTVKQVNHPGLHNNKMDIQESSHSQDDSCTQSKNNSSRRLSTSQKGSDYTEQLTVEMLMAIFLYLPYEDLLTCRHVCKRWQAVLSEGFFWKCLTFFSFSFQEEVEGSTSGSLTEWRTDWNHEPNCFFGVQAAVPKGAVFTKLPQRWRNGILCPSSEDIKDQVEDYQNFYRAVHALSTVHSSIQRLNLFYSGSAEFGWKSRGRSAIDTCLLPWQHDGLPTAEEVLELFHINPLLKESVTYEKKKGDFGGTNQLSHIFCSRSYSGEVMVFYDLVQGLLCPRNEYIQVCVNVRDPTHMQCPSPVFILAFLAPGWVGGIMTGLW
ncbi:PREDICTED: uncharacterized protein LOC109482803 [Branchiostoma belcheri]|uniref:Uncharacterized protein LOC109482803 n=1 Tax=Branchiostoma belcheri TaxID=7741 RepID=A0A6P5AD37_BRABE|nr:PREDICTED: uncharacterized protein LOC109482803 [Branchiostoma belcheri]